MKSATRLAAAATAAFALVATSAATVSAQNVIPGDLKPGSTVVTSLPGVTIDVDQPDVSTVTVTMSNNSGMNLRCNGHNDDSEIGATVTTGAVAQAAMQYYAYFAYQPNPANTLGSGNYGALIDWGAILSFLPSGSVAPLFGESFAARDWISRNHTAATLKGHTGTASQFTVNNASSFTTPPITLSRPSNGPRTDFDAAAYLICTSGSQAYAFAGYENGPPTNDGALPIGSIGRR